MPQVYTVRDVKSRTWARGPERRLTWCERLYAGQHNVFVL